MINPEHPAQHPSSEALIHDLLEDQKDLPLHYQNAVYTTIIDALSRERKTFDEIRAKAIELGIPKAQETEPADAYLPLIEELYEARPVLFQQSDGHFYQGVIVGTATLRFDIDVAQSRSVAIINVPIEYDDEIDDVDIYPRRGYESHEMITQEIKLTW